MAALGRFGDVWFPAPYHPQVVRLMLGDHQRHPYLGRRNLLGYCLPRLISLQQCRHPERTQAYRRDVLRSHTALARTGAFQTLHTRHGTVARRRHPEHLAAYIPGQNRCALVDTWGRTLYPFDPDPVRRLDRVQPTACRSETEGRNCSWTA